jgi:aspartyl-tRNA(Asn)/glutamyl-tRNA(Gln) amidotransferase subunit A
VRTPAALCGVVGLKPTFGALPTDRVFPLSETCDHVGFLTADVHGASVAWDVLARSDGTGGGIQAPGVQGVRVGLLLDDYWRAADPALNDAVAAAAKRLEARGAHVVELRTPMINELAATYGPIVGAEAYATHAGWLAERPQDYQPITRERLAATADLTASTYVAALRARRALVAQMREAVAGVDVLVLPTTRLRATPIGDQEVDVGGTAVPVRSALLALTLPFNLTGWPAVSVPGEVPDGGLPTAVQVVGVRMEERGVLRVADAVGG